MRWRTAPIALLALLVLSASSIGNTPSIGDAENTSRYLLTKTYDGQDTSQILVDPPNASLAVGQNLTVSAR